MSLKIELRFYKMAVKFVTCAFQNNAWKMLTKSLRFSHSAVSQISECKNLHLSLQVVTFVLFSCAGWILKLIKKGNVSQVNNA